MLAGGSLITEPNGCQMVYIIITLKSYHLGISSEHRSSLIRDNLVAYADDNYMGGENKNLAVAMRIIKSKIEAVTKWMTSSGLKINELKTEICIFHRQNQIKTNVTINNAPITTNK